MGAVTPGLYGVVKDSKVASSVSKTMMQSENMQTVQLIDFTKDANVSRPPDYFVYIYNIAYRTFEIRRPPYFPIVRLSACPPTEPYVKVMSIPNIVNEKWVDSASGEIRNRGTQGERFAMDLINPANIGVDMWASVSAEASWIDGGTDDMSRRGLFFSRNDPPTQEELDKAKARLETHYRRMLAQADELSRDPKTFREIGPEHHAAAEYFRVKASWHVIAELPSVCENCGETIKPGIPYHVNGVGVICIRDWQATVKAGVKKREDVPEELRWWKEKESKG